MVASVFYIGKTEQDFRPWPKRAQFLSAGLKNVPVFSDCIIVEDLLWKGEMVLMIDAIGRMEGVSPAGMGKQALGMPGGKEQVQAATGPRNNTEESGLDRVAVPTLEELELATLALEETAQAFNQRLSFVLHEESGRMQVQVIDNITREVVKEVPPSEVLEAVARIRQAVGLLLDKRV